MKGLALNVDHRPSWPPRVDTSRTFDLDVGRRAKGEGEPI
jgi:hypothetical protein